MNENLNLVEILKDCPKGMKLYSCLHGEVEFYDVNSSDAYHPIMVTTQLKDNQTFTPDGRFFDDFDGECMLFPSKDNRDWSTFVAPKKKVERFDPKTLKPFTEILVRDEGYKWTPRFFALYIDNLSTSRPIVDTAGVRFEHAIPYEGNEELYLTENEPDEYYRYWED